MLRKSFLAGLAGIVITAAAAIPAQANQWVQLGEQTVGHHTDRDIVYVGSDEGRYEALRFRVLGNRVAFAEARVVYGNGTSEVLNVKEHVQPGETTQAYDLHGQHRIIQRIEFLYQSEIPWAGRATVQVIGLKDTASPIPGGWTTLGTREVSLVADHDAITVGGGAGKFRSIRFHVSGRPIKLYDVRVTFGYGQMQQYTFNHEIFAGAYSPVLDLVGNERVISRIDLVYKKETVGGHAYMTVYGQH
jgi:Protein of unknown function (DUF2541)